MPDSGRCLKALWLGTVLWRIARTHTAFHAKSAHHVNLFEDVSSLSHGDCFASGEILAPWSNLLQTVQLARYARSSASFLRLAALVSTEAISLRELQSSIKPTDGRPPTMKTGWYPNISGQHYAHKNVFGPFGGPGWHHNTRTSLSPAIQSQKSGSRALHAAEYGRSRGAAGWAYGLPILEPVLDRLLPASVVALRQGGPLTTASVTPALGIVKSFQFGIAEFFPWSPLAVTNSQPQKCIAVDSDPKILLPNCPSSAEHQDLPTMLNADCRNIPLTARALRLMERPSYSSGSGAEELPYTSFASTDTQPHVPSGLASGNAGDPYYSPTSGVPVQAHGTSQANNYAVSGYPPPPNYTYDVQPGVYAPQAGYGAPGEASQMAPYAGSMYHPGHGNKGGRMVSDTGPYSHTTASGGSSPPSRTSTQFVPTPAQTLQTYGSGASAPSTGSRAAFLPAGSRHARSQSLTTIQIPEHPAGLVLAIDVILPHSSTDPER
ncbi:hypothetical protein GLOTRDRAFT_92227 [Gloeophyllum trabeum ATCC 11539]|uniref:Uncharacterized protein n=1 Tax=Gloeophyllum trabeum (strain ATCC 11539 / FP-39264 / Madison 617) TaxID=670483 RepID=S7QAY1_GLOTA|nr:uncharacterized protein GLOTRDRAFT_92227 [Gloeophyllum trabeum ATCC 11539]EPQ57081.1 hypothetical protein GLOTRDRAFT_92227 [Gloeophyllum trabeum ATCC 11539]